MRTITFIAPLALLALAACGTTEKTVVVAPPAGSTVVVPPHGAPQVVPPSQ
jgi:hypothetical protein